MDSRHVTRSSCDIEILLVQASTVAAGVSAYLIKSDMSKLNPAEMAQYFEERLGWAVTTAWNLTVKDVEQTISGVCQQVWI